MPEIQTSLHGRRAGLSKDNDVILANPTTGAHAIVARAPGNRLVTVTDATLTVTPDDHLDKLIVLARAAGVTVTLPAATGTGNRYRFYIGTTVTSNADIIKVANATDVMRGGAIVMQDGGSTVIAFEAASTDDTISGNGTTTSGIEGDYWDIEDVAAGKFRVNGVVSATGTEATPFSATVS